MPTKKQIKPLTLVMLPFCPRPRNEDIPIENNDNLPETIQSSGNEINNHQFGPFKKKQMRKNKKMSKSQDVKNNEPKKLILDKESQECLNMANTVNSTRGTNNHVLFLGLKGDDLRYKNKWLDDHIQSVIQEGSTIIFVSHGNPIVVGTKSGFTTTADELADNFDSLIENIINPATTERSTSLTVSEMSGENDDDETESNKNTYLAFKKADFKTHFEFQHCNSGLYPEKNDKSAMISFAGKFIKQMNKLGYTNISVSGYRGYIGELHNNNTKISTVEGDSPSKIIGPDKCKLIIKQAGGEFKVTHPIQFVPMEDDGKQIFQHAAESLYQRECRLGETDENIWKNLFQTLSEYNVNIPECILKLSSIEQIQRSNALKKTLVDCLLSKPAKSEGKKNEPSLINKNLFSNDITPCIGTNKLVSELLYTRYTEIAKNELSNPGNLLVTFSSLFSKPKVSTDNQDAENNLQGSAALSL